MTDTLRVFVAMPGTTMGDGAPWNKPDQIKKHFYQPICDLLKERLSREVELIVEKDKLDSVEIYDSMYGEATASQVYIADLTGNNPNVYLELGARWALMDRVTVLVTQTIDSRRFNVQGVRTFTYSKDLDEIKNDIKRIVQVIINGLNADPDYCDSPVRKGVEVVSITRSELQDLKNEIERLKHQRGEDLFDAAIATIGEERLSLLRQAVQSSPNRVDFLIELGLELQRSGEFEEARENLSRATTLASKNSRAWRELGVTLGKLAKAGDNNDLLYKAEEALKLAVELDSTDFESYSNLGGAQRRLAFRNSAENIDWPFVRASYESYCRASELEQHETYPAINKAKLALFLSKQEEKYREEAQAAYQSLIHLTQFALVKLSANSENAIWTRFDLAEATLFSGDIQGGLLRYAEAVEMTPTNRKSSVFGSVAGPIKELIDAEIGEQHFRDALHKVLDILKY